MLNNISTYLNKEKYRISILDMGVHILNYKSIVDVNENEIIIKVENKLIKIYGSSMIIVKLDKKELLIKGNIKSVNVNE